MKRYVVLAVGLLGLMLATVVAVADDAAKSTTTPAPAAAPAAPATPAAAATPAAEHVSILPGDLKWVDAPAGMPKGAKMAVIHGNPSAPGLFAIRAMLPAGYKVAPHWHPADENLTVISGELYMGMGDSWDESKGHALPAGAISLMPAGMHHFAWSKVETVIQIHAMGPWGITYINPQDDPRNMKQATK